MATKITDNNRKQSSFINVTIRLPECQSQAVHRDICIIKRDHLLSGLATDSSRQQFQCSCHRIEGKGDFQYAALHYECVNNGHRYRQTDNKTAPLTRLLLDAQDTGQRLNSRPDRIHADTASRNVADCRSRRKPWNANQHVRILSRHGCRLLRSDEPFFKCC